MAVGLFLCCRKRKGKGYGAGKSLRQRVGGGGHRRDASFHDEPTGGLELRERNKGLTGEESGDNWDWGSPVGSPTGGAAGGECV